MKTRYVLRAYALGRDAPRQKPNPYRHPLLRQAFASGRAGNPCPRVPGGKA